MDSSIEKTLGLTEPNLVHDKAPWTCSMCCRTNDADVEVCKCGASRQHGDKYFNVSRDTNAPLTPEDIYADENGLRTIAAVILIMGIIGFIMIVCTSVFMKAEGYYNSTMTVNWIAVASAFGTLFTSIAVYGAFKVLANVSTSLKKLNINKQMEL